MQHMSLVSICINDSYELCKDSRPASCVWQTDRKKQNNTHKNNYKKNKTETQIEHNLITPCHVTSELAAAIPNSNPI